MSGDTDTKVDTVNLDLERLSELKNDVGTTAFNVVLNAYLSEVAGRCESFPRLLASHDLKTLEIESHALKSASGSFGANHLSDICLKVEQAANRRSTDGLVELVASLVVEGHKVQDRLRGHFGV